uniref:Contactin associated protein like 3 n=1 Tax=Salarias fasciatus TaxID=181472 RepID=A0A672IGP5_SALFA
CSNKNQSMKAFLLQSSSYRGAGGWSPLTSDQFQWLEVDLAERTRVTAVATQGRYGSSDWQSSYLLRFSDTGHNWRQYRQEGSTGGFPGNSNADGVVQHRLQHPVVARYVRLVPLDWNPSGRIGLRLEVYGCPYNSNVLSFSGHSSLLYRLSPRPRLTPSESFGLNFKALRNSGILLQAEGASGHSLTLQLERGKLLLLSASAAAARLALSVGSLLDDQHWHHVALEHHGSHLNLTVDKSTLWEQIPAGLSRCVGSDSSSDPLTHFHGCLENLVYNGLNLVELAEQGDQRGDVTFSCTEPVSVALTFHSAQSFLRLPVEADMAAAAAGLSVGLQFRTWNEAGLLLTFDLRDGGGAAWLYLDGARLHLQVHKPGRAPLELSAGLAVNDGQWHSVDLISARGRLSIAVDGEDGGSAHASPSFPITAGGQLFFGGCPPEQNRQDCLNPFPAFRGCMRLLAVADRTVDLIAVQQRILGNYSHLQIDMCGIIDRCSPSHCEHGGRCAQSWSSFHCNCSHTGYSGATCHSPIYEQSCEAYKHKGNTSGFYHVDVDGSGAIRPLLVYCNMTEGGTWTVIRHSGPELTRVPSSPGSFRHQAHFQYAPDGRAAIREPDWVLGSRWADVCVPDGSLLSWWVGGPGSGQIQTFWGGADPGSQRCGCSVEGNCVDQRHHCNCDADRPEWLTDSGLLTHKETLPVRSLVLGDAQRPGSESAYRVGPLLCHGDSESRPVGGETSYLHFPTFQAELSADISFLFKTGSSSGVFLENLGVRDFIRIELSSPTEVVFSFDVGNGPLEVRVKADLPLNDERWHRVRAERNVKEASLRLDGLHSASLEAPAEGHIHLQLNSQLFIGGTASRQRGFRGCLRSLQLNGVTLDLEERARVTPGVEAGCPGHCSSYGSLCRNRGRCVEAAGGFSCDCGPSAFTGAFCEREVSVSLKSGSSISYTLEEQQVDEMNHSTTSSSSSSTLRAENVSLSFSTGQSPALLVFISSHRGQYLALLLNKREELEVRYRLDVNKEAEILKSEVKNLSDQQLHAVTVSRLADAVSVEGLNLTCDLDFLDFSGVKSLVLGRLQRESLDPGLARVAALGFSGCLSAVLFNSVSPLKAALLHPNPPSVTVTGPLLRSACGSSAPNSGSAETGRPLANAGRRDSALIGGTELLFTSVFHLLTKAKKKKKNPNNNKHSTDPFYH